MAIKIKIKKNEWDEFEVQWIENGKKNEAKTYYTDDEDDAITTKHQMRKEAEKINHKMIKQQSADHLAFCQNQE